MKNSAATCGGSVPRSTPVGVSNDTHDRRIGQFRAAPDADRRYPCGVGSAGAPARCAGLHPADAVEHLHRALPRHRQRALSQPHRHHARRDADRLRGRHGACLRARHCGGAEPLHRIFPLSVHRDVPGDAQCDALYLRRAGNRRDLCADRRHCGRVRRCAIRARHADPEHEFHHGRCRPVLGAADPLRAGADPQRHGQRGAAPRAVLGCLAEGRRRGFGAEKGRNPVKHLRLAAALAALLAATGAQAETTLRVGFCARTVSAAAAPFAIAAKMGWFTQAGFRVELVPFPGSTDCVKSVATRDVDYALPSIEPLAIIRPQGVKAKNYYTAYQGNVYGIAVPAESAVKRFEDLKGKRVGVISMSSAGVIIARALAANHGMDPDRDISIVVAGEAAQTAALLRSGEVDALSQFDTQYALVENAGVKMRPLDNSEIAKFPSNGFIAFEATLKSKRAEAVALAQGYAKGTVFAIANPAAAVRALWEVFPQTKATGKDEATALKDDVKVLEARARNWRLEAGGVTKWGENSEANYAAYVDFLLKWGVLKQKVEASDIITNELIEDINKFDPAEITDLARKQAGN